MYTYICIYIYIYTYVYMYICIYICIYNGLETKQFWEYSLSKYCFSSKKLYLFNNYFVNPFVDTCEVSPDRLLISFVYEIIWSFSFFSWSTCFALLEVTSILFSISLIFEL